MEKFGRKYELTIYQDAYLQTASGDDPSKISFTNFGPQLTTTTETVTIKNPFTLIFNIQRRRMAGPQTGNFQIYNLGATTRSQIYRDPQANLNIKRIVLKAGYTEPLPIIFNGTIHSCTSCRPQGQNNFITEINAWQNFEMQNSFTNTQFSGKVSKQLIVDQLIKDLVATGSVDGNLALSRGAVRQYTDYQYNRILSGYSWNLLKEETENNCFIDNGQLHVLNVDEYIDAPLLEINSASGLLGSPRRSQSGVDVEMLFEPSLALGQKVILNSSSLEIFNSDYQVYSFSHFGVISDAVGGKCQTNVSLYNFIKSQQLVANTPSLI